MSPDLAPSLIVLGWAQALAAGALAIAAAVLDLRGRGIPNRLCLAGTLAGLGLSFARGGWDAGAVGLKTSLFAMLAAFLLFVLFYAFGAMAAGDVKLMAALGALCGHPWFLLWVLAYTALAGGALAVVVLWRRGEVWRGIGRGLVQTGRLRYDRPPPGGRSAWKEKRPKAGRREAAPASGLPAPPGRGVSPAARTVDRAVAEASPADAPEKPADAADGSVCAPSAPASADGGGRGKPESLYLPYAVAVAAGFLLAVWQYWRRGGTWPFFWA